jgi:hypothetical protein
MQLFSVDTTMFLKDFNFFFAHKKLKNPQIHFFPLLPAQSKWPKQKNSCFKMWPIDQVYIELGNDMFCLFCLNLATISSHCLGMSYCVNFLGGLSSKSAKHRECVRNLDMRVQVHPGEL